MQKNFQLFTHSTPFTLHPSLLTFLSYNYDMVKGAIFDLDGTLLYTLEDLKDSVNFALKKFNCPERTLDEVRNFVGNGVRLLMERAMPYGVENPDFEECLKCFKEHYAKNMYNKTKPFDGIVEMLETLQARGYKTAVVSNKFDAAVKELCKNYFGNKIEIAIGESEAEGIRKKPYPDSVLKAMEILGCEKDNTFYIGDSEVDIETARNCGLKCISVTWGYKNEKYLKDTGAKLIAHKPSDILEILQ